MIDPARDGALGASHRRQRACAGKRRSAPSMLILVTWPPDPGTVQCMDRELPDRARVVVIGGGVIGTSVAYHLAHLGCEVVLLEQDRLTSGTTWHAAGLVVTFGSTSETSTQMRRYTCDLYSRLEAETGQSTGFRRTGFIEGASDRDRLEEDRRVAAFNRLMGIDV